MISCHTHEPCPCGSTIPFGLCHGDLSWNRLLSYSIPSVGEDRPLLQHALFAARKGNLPMAELLLNSHLIHFSDDPDGLTLRAEICLRNNMLDQAERFFVAALEKRGADSDGADTAGLRASIALTDNYRRTPKRRRGPKYLLIKAWGYGFWSDVDHLLGQLLLAEMTGRIPVVQWGENTLFGSGSGNAFDLYFEPVSEVGIEQLVGADSFYPPKWQGGNLHRENLNKWAGPYCRQSGVMFLGRDESVVVSDFHTPVIDLMPWIAPGSPHAGQSWHEIYRYLFDRYLHLKPRLVARIERFYDEAMRGREWLGVHVRGSDKVLEQQDLEELNREYYSVIDRLLAGNRHLKIFLLTDSSTYLEAFRTRYGKSVLTTDATRTDGLQGVHLLGHDGRQMGESVILDTYLAARCDYFIGNGGSNVSAAVGSLKSWDEGRFHLLGRDLRSNINLAIHNW